jgi:hypothetical protein
MYRTRPSGQGPRLYSLFHISFLAFRHVNAHLATSGLIEVSPMRNEKKGSVGRDGFAALLRNDDNGIWLERKESILELQYNYCKLLKKQAKKYLTTIDAYFMMQAK